MSDLETTDIVARLRSGQEPCGVNSCRVMDARSGCLCAAAADEIERLEAEIENMKDHIAALEGCQ